MCSEVLWSPEKLQLLLLIFASSVWKMRATVSTPNFLISCNVYFSDVTGEPKMDG